MFHLPNGVTFTPLSHKRIVEIGQMIEAGASDEQVLAELRKMREPSYRQNEFVTLLLEQGGILSKRAQGFMNFIKWLSSL